MGNLEILLLGKIRKWRNLCMRRKIRKIGIAIFVVAIAFTNCCFATSVAESQLAKGTENLIKDLTNWLLVLAPVLTACLVGYYLLRKSASDEMDTKRWDNRIKVALISCVGVVIASGLINLIISYYR